MALGSHPATAARRPARPGPFARGPLTARERAAAAALVTAAMAVALLVTATAIAITLGSVLDPGSTVALR